MNVVEFTLEVQEKLKKEFKVENVNSLPKLEKISVSLRVGKFKEDQKLIDSAKEDLRLITGQAPMPRYSKKSISSFKLKEGDLVGFLTTIRGKKMWFFLQKLVKVVLPSVRDFSGVSLTSIDEQGNMSLGFKDQTPYPEIDPNKVDKLRGLGLTLTTRGFKNRGMAKKFYQCLGFAFKKE